MGYQDFTNGNALPDTSLDEMSKQGVLKYASAAARDGDATLTAALREGMVNHLDSTNALHVYSGSAWSTVGPLHGAGFGWTPAVVQSGAIASTPSVSITKYWRFGRLVVAKFLVTCSAAGTANNAITVSLPVTALVGDDYHHIGTGGLVDASAGTRQTAYLIGATTTTMKFLTIGAGTSIYGGLTGSTFAVALATSDILSGEITYEAAAD